MLTINYTFKRFIRINKKNIFKIFLVEVAQFGISSLEMGKVLIEQIGVFLQTIKIMNWLEMKKNKIK